ncbi:MAG: type II toxin-antitoxin system VapC family toxin [Chloroflexi bacterium]|nr:type II toxin-antitoxin system VapC family toxin [Chloroflexota bacterium]
MPPFVDTNIFLHYLLRYDEPAARRCYDLLARAGRGEEVLETSEMVIAELVWVLSRPPIRLNPDAIRDRLVRIIDLPCLRLPDKHLLTQALEQYANSRMNFVDAYNTVLMRKRGIDRVYSYDQDFDKVPGITRVEP